MKVESAVAIISEAYDQIFASGYQVIKPYGILTEENGDGQALILNQQDSKLKYHAPDKIIDKLSRIIFPQMRLTISRERDPEKIVELILSGSIGERPYFPYKMVEYAYGRQTTDPDDYAGIDLDTFPPHANSASWKQYRREAIEKNLTDILEKAIPVSMMRLGKEPNDYRGDDLENEIDTSISKIREAFTTVVMISSYSKEVSVLKVRILDPYQSFATGTNIATDTIVQISTGGYEGPEPYKKVEHKGYFAEYVHESDHGLANAQPLFAFKALKALKGQGITPNWNNLIMGLGSNDEVIMASKSGIDLTENLTHCIVAGSRSGKGVMTLNIVASAIGSGKSIFYIDNKPDIASPLRVLNPNTFAVNGGDYKGNPEQGTDYEWAFAKRDNWVNREKIPQYLVPNIFESDSYDSYAVVFYYRALLLALAVLAVRALDSDLNKQLGGDAGIIIVVDELLNADKAFSNFIKRHLGKLVPTKYVSQVHTYRQQQVDYNAKIARGEKPGARPKAPTISSQSQYNFWFTSFYESIKASVEYLLNLVVAGLNTEKAISDIFILTQEIPVPLTSITAISDLLPDRQRTEGGTKKDIKINQILGTLAMAAGTDAFLGYNPGERSKILDQANHPEVKDKLDNKARNFVFIKHFDGPSRIDISNGKNTDKYLHDATFFKPFLIFADGDPEKYYVRNALSVAEQNKLNPNDIIRLNADPNNPGRIDPRVGLAEYLADLGQSREDIANTLQKSADFAQLIVDRLGYQGTWRDWVFDLRPEWILDLGDIQEAVKRGSGSFLKRTHTRDFQAMFPAEFEANGPEVEDLSYDSILRQVYGKKTEISAVTAPQPVVPQRQSIFQPDMPPAAPPQHSTAGSDAIGVVANSEVNPVPRVGAETGGTGVGTTVTSATESATTDSATTGAEVSGATTSEGTRNELQEFLRRLPGLNGQALDLQLAGKKPKEIAESLGKGAGQISNALNIMKAVVNGTPPSPALIPSAVSAANAAYNKATSSPDAEISAAALELLQVNRDKLKAVKDGVEYAPAVPHSPQPQVARANAATTSYPTADHLTDASAIEDARNELREFLRRLPGLNSQALNLQLAGKTPGEIGATLGKNAGQISNALNIMKAVVNGTLPSASLVTTAASAANVAFKAATNEPNAQISSRALGLLATNRAILMAARDAAKI